MPLPDGLFQPRRHVCRVAVDVLAVERLFDYVVPEAMAASVTVGTIVRVPLAGRRVRAWVVADHVDSEAPPEKLKPLAAVVSAGPPSDVVALTAWIAWRFAGPRLPLLRAASPAAIIQADVAARGDGPERPGPVVVHLAPEVGPEAAAVAAEATAAPVALVRWPPAADITDLVAALLPVAGSVLVVAPDGRMATAVAARLVAAGRTVVQADPDVRPLERARAWDRARRGDCVVVGGRRALLAPVPDLVAAIVLDDGAEALKEERSPTWHARDVAAERCARLDARLTIVSPVPPLETIAGQFFARRTATLASTGAAVPYLLPSRSAEREGWSVLEVIDRSREQPGFGMFSSRLVTATRAAVAAGGRAICVLNRKGRARLLACGTCGELARCERCEAAVAETDTEAGTDSPADARLTCRRCGHARPKLCVRCGGTKLKVLRAGVTRLQTDLAALVPGVEVAMVDASSGGVPESAAVLIGTEAVLHRGAAERRPVNLVAFLDFDAELLAPRFRAGEQALWLLARAGRLVGPRSGGGRVLVQTRMARHDVLEAAVRADPGVLATGEGARRRMLRLPPYGVLAQLTGDEPARAAAVAHLRTLAGVDVAAGEADVLVRAARHDRLADALAGALAAGRPAGRLRAEVDPLRV